MNNKYINWEDFEKIDIRSGTILSVSDFPKARKPAYILEIDFGPLGIKKSSAQITKLYDKDSLRGQQVIAVVNFQKKQIANFFSECLVLGSVDEEGTVTLLQAERSVKNGLPIS